MKQHAKVYFLSWILHNYSFEEPENIQIRELLIRHIFHYNEPYRSGILMSAKIQQTKCFPNN